MKRILRVIANAVFGLAAAFVINIAAVPLGFGIGINLINAIVIGFLGIPGLITLYLMAGFF